MKIIPYGKKKKWPEPKSV